MKKIIVWIVCLSLLSSLLLSCQNGDQNPADTTSPVGSEDVWQIAKDQLVIVRSEDASSAVVQELRTLKKDLKDALGWNVEIESDLKHTPEENSGKVELVVGDTARPISKASKNQLPSKGYVICNENGSIAIHGTNEAMLVYAIQLFSRQFVQSATDASLKLPKSILLKNEDADVITLVENNTTSYSLAYAAGCDAFPNTDSVNNGLDYEVALVLELQKTLKEVTGADFANTSTQTEDTSRLEILIGDTGRAEFDEAKKNWSVAQYGMVAVGNKLVVSGWTDVTLGKAVTAFKALISQGLTEQDGKVTVSFIKDHLAVLTTEEWITDIPQYEGGKLSGSNDASYGQLLYYYTETNADEYRAYCQKLEAEGYTKHLSNANANNLYATYVKGDTKLHVYYTDYEKAVRLITGSVKKTGLAQNDVTADPKVTDFSVTQMNLTYSGVSGGMGYVITLEDGRFVIVDGGNAVAADATRLYKLLQKLNKRNDGIQVAGWILTHEHSDHFGVFKTFVNKYASAVNIQNFYVSIPSESYRFNSLNPSSFMEKQFPALSATAKGIPVTVLHTGQKFLIGNAEFEILYTTEDLYPQPFDVFNDASVVFRVRANVNSVLFTGDIADRASGVLCDMYGSYLKSDIVQVAHHGWNGATLELYNLAYPKALMWPNSQASYNSAVSKNGSAAYHKINYDLVNTIMKGKNIYVADTYCYQFTFPLNGAPIQFTVE